MSSPSFARFGCVVLALLSLGAVRAEAASTFFAVQDLEAEITQPALKNARIGDPKDFTAVFYSLSPAGLCTASLVGPKVLLTAAHCVEDAQPVEIKREAQTYSGQCTWAAKYRETRTADWALCLMSSEPAGVLYETVATSGEELRVGSQLLLTGLGCTSPDKPPDGVFRIGESTIDGSPAGPNNTLRMSGGAATCFRDSGGPAFKVLGTIQLGGQTKRARRLVAVNSSSGGASTSNLAAITTQSATEFLQNWTQQNQVSICGIQAGVAGCRAVQ